MLQVTAQPTTLYRFEIAAEERCALEDDLRICEACGEDAMADEIDATGVCYVCRHEIEEFRLRRDEQIMAEQEEERRLEMRRAA